MPCLNILAQTVRGPKIAKSPKFATRVPSLENFFTSIQSRVPGKLSELCDLTEQNFIEIILINRCVISLDNNLPNYAFNPLFELWLNTNTFCLWYNIKLIQCHVFVMLYI